MENRGLMMDGRDREELYQNLKALERRLQSVEAAIRALRIQLDHTLAAAQNRAQGSLESTGVAGGPPTAGVDYTAAAPDFQTPQPARPAGGNANAPNEEARRYARVLVSEIELYHGADVALGRENKDLYLRLKPHIDRSHMAYLHRFGKAAPGEADFFDEEIVRLLAQNDATLLGPGYPYPHNLDPPA